MTINTLIKDACDALKRVSETPLLDCEVLLCDVLDTNRAWLRAHSSEPVSSEASARYKSLIKRRQNAEPIAYIRGFAEFYGRNFEVSPSVLIPRPESEMMIELLKELHKDDDLGANYHIADIGSGSGALGITAKLELPHSSVDFYDIDPATLEIAKDNARAHGLQARYYHQDLLADDHGPYDIVLANLPYVPLAYPINASAKHEPSIALFAGVDGLDLYRKLFIRFDDIKWEPKEIYTESLAGSHKDLHAIAQRHGYSLIKEKDLIQVFSPA